MWGTKARTQGSYAGTRQLACALARASTFFHALALPGKNCCQRCFTSCSERLLLKQCNEVHAWQNRLICATSIMIHRFGNAFILYPSHLLIGLCLDERSVYAKKQLPFILKVWSASPLQLRIVPPDSITSRYSCYSSPLLSGNHQTCDGLC